jgi:hypothetical protein
MRRLVPLLAITIGMSPVSMVHSQVWSIGTEIIGKWTVTSVITHVGKRSPSSPLTIHVEDVEPYGTRPQGSLTFDQDTRFTSIINSEVGASTTPRDPNLSDLENATGSYSAHPSLSGMIALQIDSSGGVRYRYLAITSITASELRLNTVSAPGGTTNSTLVYRRVD